MSLPIDPLPPLVLLPREEWALRPLSDAQVGVGIFSRGGSLYLQKWSIHDFPNAFFSIPDLEDAGLLEVYMCAVEKLVYGAPAMRSDAAVEVAELGHIRPHYHGVTVAIIALGRKSLNFVHRLLLSRNLTANQSHVYQARGR